MSETQEPNLEQEADQETPATQPAQAVEPSIDLEAINKDLTYRLIAAESLVVRLKAQLSATQSMHQQQEARATKLDKIFAEAQQAARFSDDALSKKAAELSALRESFQEELNKAAAQESEIALLRHHLKIAKLNLESSAKMIPLLAVETIKAEKAEPAVELTREINGLVRELGVLGI